MRLIDADALKKDDELTEWITRDTIRTGKMLKLFSELFIKKIDDAPTVEPKTGHWKEVGEEYIQVYDLNGIPSCGDERICSECGFETVFIGEHCSQYKFCPNCGAKMVEPQERSEE